MSFVYAYFRSKDGSGPYYIGLVKGHDKAALDRRIYDHSREPFFEGRKDKWEIYYIQDLSKYDAEFLESYFIQVFDSPLLKNIAKRDMGPSRFTDRIDVDFTWNLWTPSEDSALNPRDASADTSSWFLCPCCHERCPETMKVFAEFRAYPMHSISERYIRNRVFCSACAEKWKLLVDIDLEEIYSYKKVFPEQEVEA